MSGLGVYIHVPFCKRKCNYCDFCSYTDRDGTVMRAYVRELCRRISEFADSHKDSTVDTVYLGGGTPSLLPAECFGQIMDTLRASFDLSVGAEITVECNPATVGLDGLRHLRELGINRLSIGAQSANERELALLGRLHSFEELKRVFYDARAAGFDNISVDLMYGIPEQTVESFGHTLEEIVTLAPEHISAYGLKIEKGTAFWSARKELRLPDEDTELAMYTLCTEYLAANGYKRYEISNFARDGRESRHNLRYWRLEDYIGFGVAAHSCVDGERFGNSRDMDGFLAGRDITEERYTVSEEERRREYIMLGLRLGEGLSYSEYKRRFGRELAKDCAALGQMIKGGFLKERDGRVAFTTEGFFVSNAVLCELLD